MLALSFKTLVISALSLLPMAMAADANSTTSKVGWSGKLSTKDGGLSGIVVVIDSETLQINNYNLEEASAPALYWWGATDGDLGSGFRISNEQVTKTASDQTLTIALDNGKTTDDFSVVGLWCERFSANFGQATLSANGDSSSSSANATSTDSKKSGAESARTASKIMIGTSTAISIMVVALFA